MHKVGVILTAPLDANTEACVNIAKPFVRILERVSPGATMERHIGFWKGQAETSLWLYAMLDEYPPAAVGALLVDALFDWGYANKQEAIAMIEDDEIVLYDLTYSVEA